MKIEGRKIHLTREEYTKLWDRIKDWSDPLTGDMHFEAYAEQSNETDPMDYGYRGSWGHKVSETYPLVKLAVQFNTEDLIIDTSDEAYGWGKALHVMFDGLEK